MLYIYSVHEKGPVKMDFQQANLLLVLYSVHQKKTHMSYICYTYMVCMKKEKGPVEMDFQEANLLLVFELSPGQLSRQKFDEYIKNAV